jgi:branched-chain amino acid transport system substrate-binding protein
MQAVTAVLCLGLAGCAATASHQPAAENEIVIGVAGPMSGNLASFGRDEALGVKTAIADLNATGGLLGKKLRMETGDDQCDPSKATVVARDMTSDLASLVVGHFCSGSTIPASRIYAEAHIIQITAGSSDPRVTNNARANGWTTLFRVVNSYDRSGVFAAQWALKKYPQGRIAVLQDGSPYGNTISENFISTLSAGGINTVLTYGYNQKSTDFSDLVALLQKSKPDLVYIGGYHDKFALIVRQARAAGLRAEFAGGDALNTSEFADIAGASAADGVRFTDSPDWKKSPEASKAVQEMRADGAVPKFFAVPSYAAVQAWAEGVKRAGTTDGIKVAAAMRSAPIDTIIGKLSWDGKGDLEQMLYAWFVWHGNDYTQEYGN